MKYIEQRFETELHISGVGVREPMKPRIINRPNGTRDRMLMYFYNPVVIKIQDQMISCPAGTLFLWPDQASHYYGSNDAEFTHSWMHFHGTVADELIAETGFPENTPWVLNNAEVLEKRLYDLWLELTAGHSAQIIRLLFELLIRETAREYCSKTVAIPDQIRTVKTYLDNHPNRRLYLPQLAQMSGYSVPHFSALFRKYYGTSPLAYQNRLRLEHAAHLLTNHNQRISEIAAEAGYDDIYQFSRAFRKHFKISPSGMRFHAK
ncbi:MAG: AraC family transcriptional regulator [Kiritimatiellales bacterium]